MFQVIIIIINVLVLFLAIILGILRNGIRDKRSLRFVFALFVEFGIIALGCTLTTNMPINVMLITFLILNIIAFFSLILKKKA
jgi:hypothetical protein